MKHIMLLTLCVLFVSCATLQQPVDESQAVAEAPKILNTEYGLVQIQKDGTFKYLPVWVHTGSGILLLKFKDNAEKTENSGAEKPEQPLITNGRMK